MSDAAYDEAAERLLTAELASVCGRTAVGPRRHALSPWLAAALVLLGLAATFGTWWLQRARDSSAQQPEPLPPPVHTKSLRELDAVPVDCANLVCELTLPGDLARLQRLVGLRRLAVVAFDPGVRFGGTKLLGVHRDWGQPADSVLTPLATLPRLEQLHLPGALALQPAQVAALESAPALRELTLGGSRAFSALFAAALARLPHLRVLELGDMPLDDAGLRALAATQLTELRLMRCYWHGEDATAAIAAIATLQRLQFDRLGTPPLGGGPCWTTSAAALAPLRELPALHSLAFTGCTLDDAVLAGLPARLFDLELYSTSGYSAAGLRSLRALAGLRRLRFRERSGWSFSEQHRIPPVEAAAVLAEVLGTQRLHRFDFTGAVTDDLLRAVAAQPDLAELSLERVFDDPVVTGDLAVLARAPSLRTLRFVNQALRLDDLRPLARCAKLCQLELVSCGAITAAELQQALGAAITVRVVDP